ncbi:MAG: tRNA (adenosine(37)-N6)-threonylcarbamoyltransferase complex dimerization subunit type 1 TsaB, partial [Coriobacteriia bacterium]|nr:tRNA (adenosine(37)-N6)-threonylcarbamoyltransferase complex dimerization subunit type 1 TsaB [Coriobacteriia bacterium]
AFDTATDRCALALGRWTEEGVETRVAVDFEAPRAALGRLLPAVRDLLVGEGLTPGDLCEVVVGRGPGSFTGARIGVATAKGLAHGLGTPLYGAGTLDAIAWACAGRFSGLLGVVGDAMRGEVYPALFALEDGAARRLTGDRVAYPSDVVAEWLDRKESLLLAGGGLRKHAAVFRRLEDSGARILPEDLWLPSGAGLLAAYNAARAANEAGDGHPQSLLPIYTRLSDAEENERLRVGAVGSALPASGVTDAGQGGELP